MDKDSKELFGHLLSVIWQLIVVVSIISMVFSATNSLYLSIVAGWFSFKIQGIFNLLNKE